MAKTLVQIRAQIKQLEKEAAAVHAKEVAGVIGRIQEAIAFYGLTARELFGTKAAKSAIGKANTKPRGPLSKKQPAPPKYRDPASGKTWNGRGKRPTWFVQAIASGKNAEDLAIQS